jgi:hypothetical protein
MIFSMYENAGLISIFYPIAVFGYAALEEKRPKKSFWIGVRRYTVGLVLLKFLSNISLATPLLTSEMFKQTSAYLKVGIYYNKDLGAIVAYMMPEILILCFIMLHEIKL